jgi:hypothetical protein
MTHNKPLPPKMLLAIGLLLIVLPLAVNNFIRVPDFLRGLLMGIGLVFEIAAFVTLKKAANTENKNTSTDSKL